METCASANYWARELIALGHEVRLMPPQYVKPYVKRSKNDASDAEAICEAVTRPTMRFVGVKTPSSRACWCSIARALMLTRQRTQLGNAIRAHLAEFGIVAPVGRQGLDRLMAMIADEGDDRVPQLPRALPGDAGRAASAGPRRSCSRPTGRSAPTVARASSAAGCRRSPASARWWPARWSPPSPIRTCSSPGRSLSAWLGLVPRQNSTGGKERLGGITKAGDTYLRTDAVRRRDGGDPLRRAARHAPAVAGEAAEPPQPAGRGYRLANKIGRIAWAMMTSGERYREPAVA